MRFSVGPRWRRTYSQRLYPGASCIGRQRCWREHSRLVRQSWDEGAAQPFAQLVPVMAPVRAPQQICPLEQSAASSQARVAASCAEHGVIAGRQIVGSGDVPMQQVLPLLSEQSDPAQRTMPGVGLPNGRGPASGDPMSAPPLAFAVPPDSLAPPLAVPPALVSPPEPAFVIPPKPLVATPPDPPLGTPPSPLNRSPADPPAEIPMAPPAPAPPVDGLPPDSELAPAADGSGFPDAPMEPKSASLGLLPQAATVMDVVAVMKSNRDKGTSMEQRAAQPSRQDFVLAKSCSLAARHVMGSTRRRLSGPRTESGLVIDAGAALEPVPASRSST